jgi:tetratricopeptide (TPR) repeat protein
MLRRVLSCSSVASLTVFTAVASANALGVNKSDTETLAAARRMAHEGNALMAAGNYERAASLLAKAYQLVPAPTLALLEARALINQKKLLEARVRLRAAAAHEVHPHSPLAFRRAVREARRELRLLEARIPLLEVTIRNAPADAPRLSLTINAEPVSLAVLGVRYPVDPGTYRIVAVYGGSQASSTVSLSEGELRPVALELSNATGPSSRDRDAMEWPGAKDVALTAALGVGGAGLATGVVFSGVALQKDRTLRRGCEEGRCPPDLHDDLEGFRTARTVATVGYAAGLAGFGTALVLHLTSSEDPTSEAPAVSTLVPWISPNAIGVRGQF